MDDDLLERCGAGDVDGVKRLIAQGVDVNAVNRYDRQTALHLTCESGHTDLVKHLVENGADVNAVDCFNHAALWFACDRRHVELARYLLDHGASINVGANPLIAVVRAAVRRGSACWKQMTAEPFSLNYMQSMIRLLLRRGSDVNAIDDEGNTALYCACQQVGVKRFEVVQVLLEAGADVNLQTSNKLYPLMASCEANNAELVDLLVKAGADVNVRNKKEETCLHVMVLKKADASAVNITRSLLAAGIDVDACSLQSQTALYRAVKAGHEDLVRLLVKFGANANGNSSKNRPVHAACRKPVRLSVVEYLLTYGADPNSQNDDLIGRSLPLHIAASDGECELTKVLLKHGANVDATDDDGNTALYHAIQRYCIQRYCLRATSPWPCYWCSEEVVFSSSGNSVIDILLQNGADVDLANRAGEAPLYRAASSGVLLDLASKMRRAYGENPDDVSRDISPPVAACFQQDVALVDRPDSDIASTSGELESKSESLLSVADDVVALPGDGKTCSSSISTSNVGVLDDVVALLGGGRTVQTVLMLAVKNLINSTSSHDSSATVQAIRLLFGDHGADVNMQMPAGDTVLSSVVTVISRVRNTTARHLVVELVELLQFMINHGAVLQQDDFGPQPVNTFQRLATFDGSHDLILNLFRAGDGFQLVARCCDAVSATPWKVKSIRLCQAAILAGYRPSAAEETRCLQWSHDKTTRHLVQELLAWTNKDKQEPPRLMRQCRVARHPTTVVSRISLPDHSSCHRET